jgi:hypothetical protein
VVIAVINDHIKRLGITGDVNPVIPLRPVALSADLDPNHAESHLLWSDVNPQYGRPYLGGPRKVVVWMAIVLTTITVD